MRLMFGSYYIGLYLQCKKHEYTFELCFYPWLVETIKVDGLEHYQFGPFVFSRDRYYTITDEMFYKCNEGVQWLLPSDIVTKYKGKPIPSKVMRKYGVKYDKKNHWEYNIQGVEE